MKQFFGKNISSCVRDTIHILKPTHMVQSVSRKWQLLHFTLKTLVTPELFDYETASLVFYAQLEGILLAQKFVCLFVWFLNVLVNYLVISGTCTKTERLTILRAPHMRQSWETMTFVSAGHIIPTQPEGSGRPQRESNPGPPDQESRALPTELPRPLALKKCSTLVKTYK